tara:strand:- start:279 stop:461 length:183 start_codon:yes stop_codon:yes gene_type:complete
MKVYNLTIVYDENTDTVEYIEETVEAPTDPETAVIVLAEDTYESSSTIDIIKKLKEIAEA